MYQEPEKLIVYGAGGLGKELVPLIDAIQAAGHPIKLVGFADDHVPAACEVYGYPCFGPLEELGEKLHTHSFIIALGDCAAKAAVAQRLKKHAVRFATLIHPSSNCSLNYNTIEPGCIIGAGVQLTVGIRIGAHTLVNLNATVGHDCNVGAYSSIMPGVNISGDVSLQEGVYLGTGCSLINKLSIGAWSVIGAGAVVIESIPAYTTAVGVPARGVSSKRGIS